MAARVVDTIETRLTIVLRMAEETVQADAHRRTVRVY
jgi:hypothetical protein